MLREIILIIIMRFILILGTTTLTIKKEINLGLDSDQVDLVMNLTLIVLMGNVLIDQSVRDGTCYHIPLVKKLLLVTR